MNRRKALALLGAAPFGTPGLRAQAPIPVVGFLNPVSPDTYAFTAAAFREGLAKAGFVEGRNVHIEYLEETAIMDGCRRWRRSSRP